MTKAIPINVESSGAGVVVALLIFLLVRLQQFVQIGAVLV